MRRRTQVACGALLSSLLSAPPLASAGCGDGYSYGYYEPAYGYSPRAGFGALIGGILGGITGSHIGRGAGRTAGIIGGTLLGAAVGHDIGRTLDRNDDLRAQVALNRNRTGESSEWDNPDTHAHVAVTPTRTFQTADQAYCREYTTEVTVGGEKQQAYGTACRQPDGSWKIVN